MLFAKIFFWLLIVAAWGWMYVDTENFSNASTYAVGAVILRAIIVIETERREAKQ